MNLHLFVFLFLVVISKQLWHFCIISLCLFTNKLLSIPLKSSVLHPRSSSRVSSILVTSDHLSDMYRARRVPSSKLEAYGIARCDDVGAASPLKWPNRSCPNFQDMLVALHRMFGVKKIMKKFTRKECLFIFFWIYNILCPTVINWRLQETEAELCKMS